MGLDPGARRSPRKREPQARPKELLQVLQGTIGVEIASQSMRLEAGDAVTVPGDVAHAYANAGQLLARFSLAVFEPGVGSGPRPEAGNA